MEALLLLCERGLLHCIVVVVALIVVVDVVNVALREEMLLVLVLALIRALVATSAERMQPLEYDG